ncbi:hypothetical protein FQR65_LT20965 [Abscondita terminalis]|nr:hypothetical protein FQR65_LT20965 [Abscondita terminalis]
MPTLGPEYALCWRCIRIGCLWHAHRAEGSTMGGQVRQGRAADVGWPLTGCLGEAWMPANAMADCRRSKLIVGGGMPILPGAAGHPVGKSLYRPDLLDTARAIARSTCACGGRGCVAKALRGREAGKPIAEVARDDMIFGIGRDRGRIRELLKSQDPSLVERR